MKETININKESRERISSEIVLHFFRHSKKEKTNPTDDNLTHLSNEGKKLAKENCFKDVKLNQSVAFGSPRVRSQETALLMMAGENDEITGDESLQELKDKIEEDLSFGSKIGINKGLDFTDDVSSPLGSKVYDSYVKGEYLDLLTNESDKITKETGDNTEANLSAKASKVAKMIEKYIKISPKWNALVNDKDGKYEPKMERFFGTHASVPESFIIKLLLTLNREDEVKEYADFYHNEVDYLKGFDVDIIDDKENIALVITYDLGDQKRRLEITKEDLEKICE
ncbi:MAG: hypothetical protein EOM85_01365 [Candidatus Moranbacteria bacterium]|nr:hypothetical protein [Candidatus Moranbacteria bacterium]